MTTKKFQLARKIPAQIVLDVSSNSTDETLRGLPRAGCGLTISTSFSSAKHLLSNKPNQRGIRGGRID